MIFTTQMQHFSLLIKPSSHGCNLRCSYCFYLRKKEFYPQAVPKMSHATLEQMIKSYQALDLPQYDYAWQGGEPLMMGFDFYKQVSLLQEKFARQGKLISNSLQTNGTLVDEQWAAFFAQHKYLIGLSCDGPAYLHNQNRVTAGGKGSHDLVMRGRELLRKQGADYNMLTVVNSANVNHPAEVYTYFRDELGEKFHQYIECVEFDQAGALAPWAITGSAFGEFMCEVFDQWYKSDRFTVSVRLFDTVVAKLVDKTALSCPFASDCRQYFVVEHNGDIYPCDFYVDPNRWLLGNLNKESWNDFLSSSLYTKFGVRKGQVHEDCVTCEYFTICQGCCPKNRWENGSDPTGLSVLCEGWKLFYSHTMERFKGLADLVIEQREQQKKTAAKGTEQALKTGDSVAVRRNDPCPCGSGRKYKKCCG